MRKEVFSVNLVESLAYLANECPTVFKPIKENFEKLKSENENSQKIIENLGKQLATEKMERIKNMGSLNKLGKELAETKLKSMKGGN